MIDSGRIRHARWLTVVAGTTIALLRSYLTPEIPAGTDTLGFIARAQQNAHGGLASTWDPAGFGSPRTFSLEQLLGALTLVTRNTVVTYKVMAVLLVLGAGAFTYALAWRWYRSHAASALAGLLYAASPIALAQWASGHLNIEVAITMLPLQLLLWDCALERFRLRLALGLGISFALLLLDRPDMVILSFATLALYFLCRLLSTRGSRSVWRNGAMTLGVTVLATRTASRSSSSPHPTDPQVRVRSFAARVELPCRAGGGGLPRGSRSAASVEVLCRAGGGGLPRRFSFASRVMESRPI